MHPDWLSNAYLLADEPGGTAVFIDSGAPLEPLHEIVERERLNVTHLLTTHSHPDHVAGDAELVERYGARDRQRPARDGRPHDRGPGDAGPRVRSPRLRRERDRRLHGRHPLQGRGRRRAGRGADSGVRDGHADDAAATRCASCPAIPTRRRSAASGRRTRSSATGAARRRRSTRPVRVGGEDATLVVWSPDYDGKGKAMVRFADGREAIIGGSRVER